MLRCNGLEIQNPKHMWKSENGPLQPILATKRYVTFFLGHPVQNTQNTPNMQNTQNMPNMQNV